MLEMNLQGDKQLIRKIRDMEPKVAKKAIKKGSRQGNKLILKKARSLAPKLKKSTKDRVAGQLKKNIKVQTLKDRIGSFGTRVTIVFKGATKANWYYGAWQNYGWNPKAKKKDGTYVMGRPVMGKNFMQNARNSEGQQALKVATEVIREEIIKAW